MALQMDHEAKPTAMQWLAEDAWFTGLMRDVHREFTEGYRDAHELTQRRFGTSKDKQGPQRKGA